MKRILAYCHAYVAHGREAGAETTLANLLESLVRAGWTADVLLSTPGIAPYVHNGVSVRSTSRGSELLETARTYDALITHLECSEQTALVGKRWGVPVVQLIHNTMWQTEGYLNEGCQLAVFNTEWVKAHHEKNRGFRLAQRAAKKHLPNRISFRASIARSWYSIVVHPQIDPSDYVASESSRHMITMVNAHENKGPEIFYALSRRFPKEKFLLVKGGYGHQDIRPQADYPNVTVVDNVPVDEMRHIYSRTKIIVMPSIYESFGRVAVEAASQGIPSIATGTPGLGEALRLDSFGSGLLVDPRDRDDISEWETGLKSMLDGRVYKRLSKEARQLSSYWDAQREIETKAFVEMMAKL